MAVRDRIRRLEGYGGRPCRECGWEPGMAFEVGRVATPEDLDWSPRNETCEECGRIQVLTLDIGRDVPWPEEEE